MTITTIDQLVDALANNAKTLVFSKASIGSQASGGYSSLWRATGQPGQAAIPGAAATPTKATLGSWDFTNPTSPARSYLGRMFAVSSNSGTDTQIHDRLGHMGGLSGTSTASQTVSVDVSGSGNNLPNRRGASDYSEVLWWVEIYTAIGTTAVTATITYTNGAGTSGQTTTLTVGGASPANQPGRLFQIVGSGGEPIRSIESLQLSASTGTAGSFGITATRNNGGLSLGLANAGSVGDWAQLGLPRVHDDACLFFVVICGTTSTGTLNGNMKLIQG